jgi:hypothetical protein
MADERDGGQDLGFWLRIEGEWHRFELDFFGLDRITGWGGSVTAQLILIDKDAADEPLPLLAQRFNADRVRCRTGTLSFEATIKLKAIEGKPKDRATSWRSLSRTDGRKDEAAQACTRLVEVEFDVR